MGFNRRSMFSINESGTVTVVLFARQSASYSYSGECRLETKYLVRTLFCLLKKCILF